VLAKYLRCNNLYPFDKQSVRVSAKS
jgi:hypothetical protein